jgi:hypothetical protein
MALKLPPYARSLVQKRRRGLAPATRDLAIVTDWNIGKAWPWRIVVPDTEDPTQLDFSVVAGLSCLLMGHDRTRMDVIARAVIPFAPARLIGARLGGKLIDVYWPSEIPLERAA